MEVFEIIRHTLLKLPVKSLIRFQCVCKEWCSIIQDPDFKLSYRGQRRVIVATEEQRGWRNFVARSITDNFRVEPKFSVRWNFQPWNTHGMYAHTWCSCNGFVLLNVEQHILLWNPSIRCCTKVLELHLLTDFDYGVLSGLCYDSSTGDYKAVLLLSHQSADYRNGGRFVIVASLKNKQWSQVPFPYNLRSARAGIDFQGTLHWRASDIKRERRQTNYYDDELIDSNDWEWDNFSRCNKIVYFDPECDEFKDLPTPEPARAQEEDSIVGLGIVDGCFCMARIVKETAMIEVLVMEKYKIKESWVRKLVIPISKFGNDYYDRILYSVENISKVLIWSCGEISAYDLKKNKMNKFLEPPKYGRHIGISFYVESFDLTHEFIWRVDQHKHYGKKIKWMDR